MLELTPAQAKGQHQPPLGLYIHVPFCATACDYCAFYQTQPTAESVRGFLAGVAREARLVTWNRLVETVFWGGGTPGMLAPRALTELGEIVRRQAGGPPAEWSVELAPASVTPQRLAALKDLGVTRISMGVQSFQPVLLEAGLCPGAGRRICQCQPRPDLRRSRAVAGILARGSGRGGGTPA
jgi:oxygen-independent coproporphyrinogen-3 oxidase